MGKSVNDVHRRLVAVGSPNGIGFVHHVLATLFAVFSAFFALTFLHSGRVGIHSRLVDWAYLPVTIANAGTISGVKAVQQEAIRSSFCKRFIRASFVSLVLQL